MGLLLPRPCQRPARTPLDRAGRTTVALLLRARLRPRCRRLPRRHADRRGHGRQPRALAAGPARLPGARRSPGAPQPLRRRADPRPPPLSPGPWARADRPRRTPRGAATAAAVGAGRPPRRLPAAAPG